MKRKRAKWAILAVPVLIALALWPIARENRRRAKVQANTREMLRELRKLKPNLAKVRRLTSEGANTNAKEGGYPAIHFAMRDPTLVRNLLDHGANPNAIQPDGSTVAQAAVSADRPDFVLILISKGLDVHATDRFNQTLMDIIRVHLKSSPCPHAARWREIQKLLKSKGAKSNFH